MPLFVDIAGQKFGELVALEVVGKSKQGGMIWRCRCLPCGREDVIAKSNHLRRGEKVNCGCTWGARHTKHGMAGSPEYAAYYDARRRCSQDPNYTCIKFLFTSFEQWFTELGMRPSSEHSVDRKNNDGNYELGNVRWATRAEQNSNQRRVGELQARITELEKENARLKALLPV